MSELTNPHRHTNDLNVKEHASKEIKDQTNHNLTNQSINMNNTQNSFQHNNENNISNSNFNNKQATASNNLTKKTSFQRNNTANKFKTNTSNNNLKSSYRSNITIGEQPALVTRKKCNEECCQRNGKVDSDKYHKVTEENERLKLEQQKLNDKFKALQTQLYGMGEKLIKERYLGEKKVIYMDDGTELEIMTLKNENEKLKDQLKKTKTIIKGMQTQGKVRAVSGKKVLINPKSMNDHSSFNHNEYLKLIKELKVSLNDKDTEIKRLQADLFGPNRKINSIETYGKDIREKNSELSDVQNRCEKLQLNLETNTKVMKHMEDNLKEYQEMIREEQKKNIDLRNENANLQASNQRLPEYLNMIENYKKRELEFESKIRNLCESPFIRQAEERGNVYRKLQEAEAALKEQTFLVQKNKQNIIDLEKENNRLKKEFDTLKKERDQFKEDAIRFKVTNEERDKNSRNFEEQLRLVGQYGEVDSNFTKILSLLKLKDDDNSWMKIEFFDRLGEDNLKNPEFLLKEIEKLVQEKGELGKQLEVTKNVLVLQQKISEDLQKEKQELEKITNYQFNELKKKYDLLCRRTDLEKKGKKNVNNNYNNNKDLSRLLGEKHVDYDPETASIAETITEFTRDDNETAFGMNENALDLYIGEAVLEEGISNEIGVKLADLLSFCTVDFYMHELQSSNISSGKRPWYNLQLKYHVSEDEHLIKYLNSNSSVSLEIHYVKDNVNFLLGYGFIPLNQILDAENSNNRVINSVCPIYYSKDSNILIGNIHYKMRMRQPIQETIKWVQDKMKMINNASANQHIVNIEADKNIQTIQDLSKGKVMQVTVLLTQFNNLVVSGPPHEIRPYAWYQFHRAEEHFSKTFQGTNALMEDINVITSVYDTEFDDYIQKGELSIMVLDDFRALEVKIKGQDNENQVELVDNPEIEDLIGICKISLKDLVLHDRIQGNFPIINRKGNKSGELGVLIFWEQLAVVNNKLKNMPYESKAWEEEQILKLGEKLRAKKLNIESAFEFFNIDNQDRISVSNFKLVMMTQMKYTDSRDIDIIVDLIFQDKLYLSKLDFNKIFMPLLPSANNNKTNERPAFLNTENNTSTNNNNNNNAPQVTEIKVVHQAEADKKKEDLKEENTNFEIKDTTNNLRSSINNQNINNQNYRTTNTLRNSIKENEKDSNFNITYKSGDNRNSNKNFNVNKSQQDFNRQDTNRNTKDVMFLVQDYMKRTNKYTISELFKVFDKDTNSFISNKEVFDGFFKINVPISQRELDRIWNEMVEEDTKKEKIDLSLFKRFFEKYGVAKRNVYN